MAPRKPNELHVFNGTHRSDRHGPKETAAPSQYLEELPPAPSGLGDAGKSHYESLGKELISQKRIIRNEEQLVLLAGINHQLIMDVNAEYERQKELFDGNFVADSAELMRCSRELRQLTASYISVSNQLGTNPAARAAVNVSVQPQAKRGVPTRTRAS